MFAGRSVLAWQVALARDLACERIICFCDAPGEEVFALQRQVEAAGGEFHAIRSNLQLVSLMRADDDLVMMLDGLLPDRNAVLALAGSAERMRKGIATIPSSHVLSEANSDDFERIDRDRNWAGFAVMRAGQVQKLADLPPDGDAMSMLLRLGLQAKVECRDLDSEALDGHRWLLAGSTETLAKREQALLTASAPMPPWTGPGRAIAAIFVKQIAPRWFDIGPEASAALTALLMIVGLALAGFGYGALGLGAAGLGALTGAASVAWARLRERIWSTKSIPSLHRYVPLGVDIAAIISMIVAYGWSADPVTQLALPILALGLARLASRDCKDSPAAFWQDRALHLTGFAIAAATGYLGEVLAVFALAALVQVTLRR